MTKPKLENTVRIRNSIATKLLKVVFALYIIVAAVVTIGHMVMEYRYQKSNISRDLEGIQLTFEQELAGDIWHMREESLRSTVKGMLEIPTVVGVTIENDKGDNIAIGGVIEHNGEVGEVGLHVRMLGGSQEESTVHEEGEYGYELIGHSFPIIYTYKEGKKQLGEATIYSSTSVIFQRVKLGFLLLIVTAFFKIAVLWFIFIWAFKSILRRPLSILTTATGKVDLDNLVDARVDIRRTGDDELKLLADSFNAMIGNLQMSLDERNCAREGLVASEQQLRANNQQLRANELEREELVKTLEYKNRELRDIVYTTSHDLRSPLVNIEGFSGELHSDCDRLIEMFTEQSNGKDRRQDIEALLKENIPESLEFISGSAKKMSSLLNGLLQISRVGTVEMKCEFVDVNKVMDEVLLTMEFQLKENNIAVMVDTLADCFGDPDMLNKVFSNLVQNAIKYRDPGRKSEIRISSEVIDFMTVYCVADNGVGIAAGHQKKVFEIFHRLNPEDDIGGEGLGLTIVTRVLDRLGGSIRVESEPGKGSKFFVYLPKVK